MKQLRWKYVYRGADSHLPLALLLVALCAFPALADEAAEFGRATMGSRIEPQDLDRQAAMATILGDTLRSTSGWRRQGSSKTVEKLPSKVLSTKPQPVRSNQVAADQWRASGGAKRGAAKQGAVANKPASRSSA